MPVGSSAINFIADCNNYNNSTRNLHLSYPIGFSATLHNSYPLKIQLKWRDICIRFEHHEIFLVKYDGPHRSVSAGRLLCVWICFNYHLRIPYHNQNESTMKSNLPVLQLDISVLMRMGSMLIICAFIDSIRMTFKSTFYVKYLKK